VFYITCAGTSAFEIALLARQTIRECLIVGSALVDMFPVLKYLPTWFPGAGFRTDLSGRDPSNPLAFGRTVHLHLCSINDKLFITLLALEVIHDHGHTRHNARDIMPSGATQEDTNQLNRLSFLRTSTQIIFSYHS